MKTYAERLEWAMLCARLDPRKDGQSELAKMVGCKPQTIQHLLDHNKNAKWSSYTPKIAAALQCDVNWLADNAGVMPKMHKGGAAVSNGYLDVAPIRETTSYPLNGTGPKVVQSDANVLQPCRDLPVLSYEKASQMNASVDPATLGESLGPFRTYRPVSNSAFAIPIEGPSMLGRFEPGDVVVIDPGRPPKPGKFVLARTHTGEAVFRKYREVGMSERGMIFELVPLNSDFATLHSQRDGLAIIGTMDSHTKYDSDE